MISEAELTEYLDSVASSRVLGKSGRRLKLLEHILHKEVAGEGASRKAYSIGIDAMDKPDDFDPSIDSSVRVEMGRLRTALVQFEKRTDIDCALVVDIPVGSYRPNNQKRDVVPAFSASETVAPRSTTIGKVTGFGFVFAVPHYMYCAVLFCKAEQFSSETRDAVSGF